MKTTNTFKYKMGDNCQILRQKKETILDIKNFKQHFTT
jgi:hypothetical protein